MNGKHQIGVSLKEKDYILDKGWKLFRKTYNIKERFGEEKNPNPLFKVNIKTINNRIRSFVKEEKKVKYLLVTDKMDINLENLNEIYNCIKDYPDRFRIPEFINLSE